MYRCASLFKIWWLIVSGNCTHQNPTPHQICMNWGMPNSRKYAAMDRRWWAERALVHVPFHFIYILVLLHSLNTRWCFIAIHIQLMQCIGSAAIWSDLLMCTMLRRHINPKYIWLPTGKWKTWEQKHIQWCGSPNYMLSSPSVVAGLQRRGDLSHQ